MAGGRRSKLARLTLVAFVGLLDEPSAGQYPSQVNTRVNFFEKNIQINCRSRCHAVTPTMTSFLTLTQQPIVIHLKMDKRTLRQWRISARNFCKISPNESEKLWLVKELVLFGYVGRNGCIALHYYVHLLRIFSFVTHGIESEGVGARSVRAQ